MPEQELNFMILLFEHREDGIVDCIEHLEGVGTDIVEEELDCVEGFGGGCCGELLAGEFGCECHDGRMMSLSIDLRGSF